MLGFKNENKAKKETGESLRNSLTDTFSNSNLHNPTWSELEFNVEIVKAGHEQEHSRWQMSSKLEINNF